MFSASRAGTTSRAERICEQIPLEDRMVEGQHLQREIFSRTEKENRVESLPSPNSKKFPGAYLNCRPPTFQLLSYLMFYIMRREHV